MLLQLRETHQKNRSFARSFDRYTKRLKHEAIHQSRGLKPVESYQILLKTPTLNVHLLLSSCLAFYYNRALATNRWAAYLETIRFYRRYVRRAKQVQKKVFSGQLFKMAMVTSPALTLRVLFVPAILRNMLKNSNFEIAHWYKLSKLSIFRIAREK